MTGLNFYREGKNIVLSFSWELTPDNRRCFELLVPEDRPIGKSVDAFKKVLKAEKLL